MTKGGVKIRPRVLRYLPRCLFAVVLALFLVGVGGGGQKTKAVDAVNVDIVPVVTKTIPYGANNGIGIFRYNVPATSFTSAGTQGFRVGKIIKYPCTGSTNNKNDCIRGQMIHDFDVNKPIYSKWSPPAKNSTALKSTGRVIYTLDESWLNPDGKIIDYYLAQGLVLRSARPQVGPDGTKDMYFYLAVDHKEGKILYVANKVKIDRGDNIGKINYLPLYKEGSGFTGSEYYFPQSLKQSPLNAYFFAIQNEINTSGLLSIEFTDDIVDAGAGTGAGTLKEPDSTESCKLDWKILSGGGIFGWLFCEIAFIARGIGNFLLNHGFNWLDDALGLKAGSETMTEQLNRLAQSGQVVNEVWRSILSIINFAALAGLLVVAFANVFRLQIDTYAVKKALPALVAAIILANFSFMICRAVIDFSSVLTNAFLIGEFNATQGPTTGTNKTQAFKKEFNEVQSKADSYFTGDITKGAGAKNFNLEDESAATRNLKSAFHSIAVMFAGAIVFALGFLLTIRRYIVLFLVCLSPLAFFGLAFPLAKAAWDAWWKNFMQWAFMSVVVAFWLWLGSMFIGSPIFLPRTDGSESSFALLAGYALSVLCLILALYTPFKMAGAFSGVMSGWAGIGKKALRFAGRQAGGVAGYGWGRYKTGAMAKQGMMARVFNTARSFKTKTETEKALYESAVEEFQKAQRKKRIGSFEKSKNPAFQRLFQTAVTDLGGTLSKSTMLNSEIVSFGKLNDIRREEIKDAEGNVIAARLLDRNNKEISAEDKINYFSAVQALQDRGMHHYDQDTRKEAGDMVAGMKNIFAHQREVAPLGKTRSQRDYDKGQKDRAGQLVDVLKAANNFGAVEHLAEEIAQRKTDVDAKIKIEVSSSFGELNKALEDILTRSGVPNASAIISRNASYVQDWARNEVKAGGNLTPDRVANLLTDISGQSINSDQAQLNANVSNDAAAVIRHQEKSGAVKRGVEYMTKIEPMMGFVHGRAGRGIDLTGERTKIKNALSRGTMRPSLVKEVAEEIGLPPILTQGNAADVRRQLENYAKAIDTYQKIPEPARTSSAGVSDISEEGKKIHIDWPPQPGQAPPQQPPPAAPGGPAAPAPAAAEETTFEPS